MGKVFIHCASAAVVPIAGISYSIIPFSVSFFLLLLLTLPLFFGVFGVVFYQIDIRVNHSLLKLLILPSMWTAMEYLCINIFGLPISLAVTQSGNPLILQSASIVGIYGVSFLIILANTFLDAAIRTSIAYRRGLRPPFWSAASLVVGLAVLGGNLAYGALRLGQETTYAQRIPVYSLQPSIPSEIYRAASVLPETRRTLWNIFHELTGLATGGDAGIIFWPEGGNGYYNFRIPELRERIYEQARASGSDMVISSLDIDEQGKLFNSVFSVSGHGRLLGRYNKVKLTPIGEEAFTAGNKETLLQTSYGPMGVVICFESCFPSKVRKLTAMGARLLAISTSDAAFRKSVLPLLHASIAVYRAIENHRFVVRAANTGPSMIIDPLGRVTAHTPFFMRTVMTGWISPDTKKTAYVRFGDVFPVVCTLVVLLTASVAFMHVPHRQSVRFSGTHKARTSAVSKMNTAKYFIEYTVFVVLAVFIHVAGVVATVGSSIHYCSRLAGETSLLLAEARDFFSPMHKVAAQEVGREFIQAKSNTCGPAALAYLLSLYGRETKEEDILRLVTLRDEGVSMLDLAKAAEQFGFKAWGERQNWEALRIQPKPLIAYINPSHYVVIIDIRDAFVHYFDPSRGYARVDEHTFRRIWNGYVFIVSVRAIAVSRSATDRYPRFSHADTALWEDALKGT